MLTQRAESLVRCSVWSLGVSSHGSPAYLGLHVRTYYREPGGSVDLHFGYARGIMSKVACSQSGGVRCEVPLLATDSFLAKGNRISVVSGMGGDSLELSASKSKKLCIKEGESPGFNQTLLFHHHHHKQLFNTQLLTLPPHT